MATTTLKKNNNSYRNYSKPSPNWSDEEEDTEMAGSNRGKIEREEVEFLVKWQLPGNLDVNTAKKQLTTLLAELMISFSDVNVVDHKKREWKFDEKEGDEKFLKEIPNMTVPIHPVKNQQRIIRWIAITRVRAISRISDWKRNDAFYAQAIEAKVYIFPHPFKYEDWDITSIGFIKNIHTTHFPHEHLHDIMSEYLQKHETSPPTFQLIPQKITNQERNATTRAYTVQCAKSEAKRMGQLLTQGDFRTTQMFIPFKYKRSQPDLFTTCIKQQNEVYYKTWVVKVEGISREVMHFIMDDLQLISGIYHVVPTKNIDESGEWKILVDQAKSPYIHRQLQEKWQQILSNVPSNFLEMSPSAWSTPRISSKKIREYQDDSSSDDSYGSLLTSGTNDSLMTNSDDNLHELPEPYKYPSYAAVVAPRASTDTATTLSSPTASDLSEWKKEKADLEALIKNQADLLAKFQADQVLILREIQAAQAKLITQLHTEQAHQFDTIQADIQTKVSRSKDLEDQLAQALEVAYIRTTREEEVLQKIETIMQRLAIREAVLQQAPSHPNNPNSRYGASHQVTPYHNHPVSVSALDHTTPPRTNTSRESPPSKKANTNPSPQRDTYDIFKPPTSRTVRPPEKPRQSPPRLLTQPMEDDDDHKMPMPMVNLGKKIE